MVAMYAAFGMWFFTAIDPILLAPLVTALMFVFGALAYLGVVRYAMRAKANIGMVQIFATFGLAILIQGVAQYLFTPDYRSITGSWLGGQTLQIGGIFLPWPQIYGGIISVAVFGGLYLLMSRTDFGRALEATREDQGAVALVGIDRNRVFALGWGLGAALVGLAGAVLAIFYYIHPQVGGTFALIAYVTVALGGFGSVFGALVAGVIVGLVEALTAVIAPPALKSVGVYALYLAVVFVRPSGLFGRL
jgi:branched-chain amino acid transport system permease protein